LPFLPDVSSSSLSLSESSSPADLPPAANLALYFSAAAADLGRAMTSN
jgi:hypothetical protein